MSETLEFERVEQDRRIANLIRLGVIAEVDHGAKLLRVRSGEALTDWIAWPAEVGRNFVRWRPLRVGTQVILGSASGDLSQAVVLGMLYTASLPAPDANPDVDLIRFENGAEVRHDMASGAMAVVCQGDLTLKVAGAVKISCGGEFDVTAGGTATLTAPAVAIDGPVSQSGGNMELAGDMTTGGGIVAGSDVKAGGDVTAGAISLKTHIHSTPAGPSGPSQ